MIGFAAAGVGVEHIIMGDTGVALPAPKRWLICGSVALCLLALGFLHRTGVIFRCSEFWLKFAYCPSRRRSAVLERQGRRKKC